MGFSLDRYLKMLNDCEGTDLHIAAGTVPKFRIHGKLHPVPGEGPWLHAQVEEMLLPMLDERRRGIFLERRDLDWAYSLAGVARFRVNYFVQHRGMGAVFRLIPRVIRTCKELGVPEVIESYAHLRNGLILCTGPTGSGKSTTLAAIVDYINRNFQKHIITIEEPIEYVHDNKRSFITQREVGEEAESFATALRAATRQDPDVILVGELRDLETIGLAITAAELGALVFATLHTNSAAKTIDRIIDVFPESQQNQVRTMLSVALKGVIAQLLIPTRDGGGRVAVNEILLWSFSLGNMIREGAVYKIVSLIEAGRGEGMQLMDDSIMVRYKAGLIDARSAHLWALDKKRFEGFLEREQSGK